MNKVFLSFLTFIFSFSLLQGDSWKPDFLIVGAQKTGTSALYELIQQHPLVVKKDEETHFFDLNFDKGVNWYKLQYKARNTQKDLIGDKSPYYLFHPLVPQRVFNLYPHVKNIIMLRNPVDRAYSQYWHNIRAEREPLSFAEAIAKESERLEGEKEKILQQPFYNSFAYQHYSYKSRGIYIDQVQRWFELFPKEQILVIAGSDLLHHPDQVMSEVFTFLGLNPTQCKESTRPTHKHEPMSESLRKELSDYYRPYNIALEEFLGRKFNWN